MKKNHLILYIIVLYRHIMFKEWIKLDMLEKLEFHAVYQHITSFT